MTKCYKESLLSLFKAENIHPSNKQACLQSISETCLPTKLTQLYLTEILPMYKSA